MTKRDEVNFDRYPTTWPFPVGPWTVPAFWFVVVLVASLLWLFN